MSCQDGKPDFSLSIVSESEIMYHDACKNTFTQKKIDANGGSVDTHFTFAELKDIGAMLHDSPEFKSHKFEHNTALIVNLGRTLAREDLTRQDLVAAILALMKAWLQVCQDDSHCILPTPLDKLKDPNQQKQAAYIASLQTQLRDMMVTNLMSRPVGSLTDDETRLLTFNNKQKALSAT